MCCHNVFAVCPVVNKLDPFVVPDFDPVVSAARHYQIQVHGYVATNDVFLVCVLSASELARVSLLAFMVTALNRCEIVLLIHMDLYLFIPCCTHNCAVVAAVAQKRDFAFLGIMSVQRKSINAR